jgi:general secretion pathway protein C
MNERLIVAVNLCLGFVLIIVTLLLVRDVLSVSLGSKKKITVNNKSESSIIRHALHDYSVILKNNPFGFPAGELTQLSVHRTPVSNTDITLVGAVAGRREISYAIFVDNSGRQEVFRAGDSVFGAGILDKVEKDRVFLKSGDDLTEILLKDITAMSEPRTHQRRAAVESGFSKRISNDTYFIDQKKIQQAVANPKELMTDARLVPNFVDGKQQGFVLDELKPGGIYQSLGLQNGDVLLRINDYDISNPEFALQAFNALQGMDMVQLDIVRNGSKMTMTYQIK